MEVPTWRAHQKLESQEKVGELKEMDSVKIWEDTYMVVKVLLPA